MATFFPSLKHEHWSAKLIKFSKVEKSQILCIHIKWQFGVFWAIFLESPNLAGGTMELLNKCNYFFHFIFIMCVINYHEHRNLYSKRRRVTQSNLDWNQTVKFIFSLN